MNLLNYVDRFSFFAVGTHIQTDLRINDRGFGILGASFMIVYTAISPLVGWLGDRYHRRALIALGVGLWSVATVGTAFAGNFAQMLWWRALLGVGEASYGVIAPALLADLFEPKYRGRVMGLYFLALPLGGALGYGLGGWIAHAWHWRAARIARGLSITGPCCAIPPLSTTRRAWPRSRSPQGPMPPGVRRSTSASGA
jgi:MFS family permease